MKDIEVPDVRYMPYEKTSPMSQSRNLLWVLMQTLQISRECDEAVVNQLCVSSDKKRYITTLQFSNSKKYERVS